jgi:hypothetical protein
METIIIILFAHFVSDFILQTDKQAINKSKSNKWLTVHVSLYSLSMLVFQFSIFDSITLGICWVVINGLLHWGQDWYTSRLNSMLYANGERHWFFVGIGADQFLHYVCLLMTYKYLQP